MIFKAAEVRAAALPAQEENKVQMAEAVAAVGPATPQFFQHSEVYRAS